MFSFVPEMEIQHSNLSEKQQHILEVAERLFSENGFDGTSVRHISKEAGINVAMISYYFGSKEKLLETLIDYRISGFKYQMELVISEEKTYFEKIDEIISILVSRIHRNRKIHQIMNFEHGKDLRNINMNPFIQQKTENYQVLEKFVKQGQEAGVFTKNVHIPLLFPTILGTYFHFYFDRKFYCTLDNMPDENSLEDFIKTTLTQNIQKTIKALLTYAD